MKAYAVSTGACVFTISGHKARVSGLGTHPTDPTQVITTSLDGTVRTWDGETGAAISTLHLGLPIVRVAVTSGLPADAEPILYVAAVGRYDASATAAAALGQLSESSSELIDGGASAPFALGYPLGDEVACLNGRNQRPLPTSLPFVYSADGRASFAPKHCILEVSLGGPAGGRVTRLILNKRAFIPSMEARVIETVTARDADSAASLAVLGGSGASSSSLAGGISGAIPDVALAFVATNKLHVWRSGTQRGTIGALTKYAHKDMLTSVALHPTDAYAVTGDTCGKLITWFLPDLRMGFQPVQGWSSQAGTFEGAAAAEALIDGGEALAATERGPRGTGKEAQISRRSAKKQRVGELLKAGGKDDAARVPVQPLELPMPQVVRAPTDSVTTSEAHWHAHAVWGLAFSPDGSFLASGGEEAVLVLWALEGRGGGAGGGGGPNRNKATMTFLPRLGAPIRTVSAWASGAQTTRPAAHSSSSGGGSQVQRVPPLMFGVSCTDNSVAIMDGVGMRPMWRVRGLAVAGLPATALSTVLAALTRSQVEGIKKRLAAASSAASEGADADAAALSVAPLRLGPSSVSTVLNGLTRYLRRGAVLDPRTLCLVVNGLPGKGSLQWVDAKALTNGPQATAAASGGASGNHASAPGCVTAELDVSQRNLVSRLDATPAPPVRITHVAFSPDGRDMATVEVAATIGGNDGAGRASLNEAVTLKFWAWENGRWVLNTRVEAPHKTDVTALEFHPSPSSRMVLTASADRTFKLWERGAAAATVSVAHEVATASSGKAKAAAHTGKHGGGGGGGAPGGGSFVWSCRSVGFYRDAPATAGSFSADGSVLAVAYGSSVTLWDWRDNTLTRTLAHASVPPAEAAPGGALVPAPTGALAPVTHVLFAGLSPFLVTATPASLTVWDCLAAAPAWRYDADAVVAVAGDRVGLATSSRFAVVVRVDAAAPSAGGDAAPSPARYYALLFDAAASAVPLAVWQLPASPAADCAASGALLPPSARASPYTVTFAPAASDSPSSAPNDVLVLGPLNEAYRFPCPAHRALGDRAGVHTSTESAAGGSVTVTMSGATAVPGKAGAAKGPLVVTGAPTSAASGLARVVGAAKSAASAAAAAAAAPAAPRSLASSGAFGSLLSSLGPVQALPSHEDLYASLMAALLPPAASASAAGAESGGVTALSGPVMVPVPQSGAQSSSKAGGGAVRKRKRATLEAQARAAQLAGGDNDDLATWGLGGADGASSSAARASAAAPAAAASHLGLSASVLAALGLAGTQQPSGATVASSAPATATAPTSTTKSAASGAAVKSASKATGSAPASAPPTPATAGKGDAAAVKIAAADDEVVSFKPRGQQQQQQPSAKKQRTGSGASPAVATPRSAAPAQSSEATPAAATTPAPVAGAPSTGGKARGLKAATQATPGSSFVSPASSPAPAAAASAAPAPKSTGKRARSSSLASDSGSFVTAGSAGEAPDAPVASPAPSVAAAAPTSGPVTARTPARTGSKRASAAAEAALATEDPAGSRLTRSRSRSLSDASDSLAIAIAGSASAPGTARRGHKAAASTTLPTISEGGDLEEEAGATIASATPTAGKAGRAGAAPPSASAATSSKKRRGGAGGSARK